MSQLTTTTSRQETAILVALTTPQQSSVKTREYAEELAFLALTLGIKTLHTFTQSLKHPHVKTWVGKGKLQEIDTFIKDHAVDMVIFDDTLTPSQVRNLEALLQCKILDRNLLILNIFAMRAKTMQAMIQVELAQYLYLLPRLTRMWTHLSKQKGGNAGMRGPGEKEIETDRRIVQTKIARLKNKLAVIERQSSVQRKRRTKLVRVALIGYTNAGKSTLMNVLSKADVQVENKLFATVDATTRKIVIRQVPFLLTDTVGFIRKLPHTLIECFKSTLAEVREADILVHVVDSLHPAREEHITVVRETLQEIGLVDRPTILVLNKADRIKTSEERQAMATSLPTHNPPPSILISATQQSNIDVLKKLLFQQVYLQHIQRYPNYLRNSVY